MKTFSQVPNTSSPFHKYITTMQNKIVSGLRIGAFPRENQIGVNMARFPMRSQLNNILIWKLIENNRRRRMYLLNIMSFLATRKKMLLHIYFLVAQLIQSVGSSKPGHRSCRRCNRNTGWWSTVWHTYSDSRLKKTLRVSRKTFQHILEPIRHRLERWNINEEPITPEERFGICLYRLGRGDYYHTIAEMTGLGVATVCTILLKVSRAIVEYLWAEKVSKYLPTNQEMFMNKMVDMEGFGNFHTVGRQLMDAISRSSVHLVGLNPAKNFTTLKTFIRWS